MLKIGLRLSVAFVTATVLLTLLLNSVTMAAPVQQESPPAEAGGQEYVVQVGDWLSRISREFYGSTSAFPTIVEATNAKAESDPRFDRVTDPNVLRVGQRLWIPNNPSAPAAVTSPAAVISETTVLTSTHAISGTTAMTATQATAGSVATSTVSNSETMSQMVRIVAPENGATVPPRFDMAMTANGITIEPAGEIHEDAGHFHVLIDTDFVAPGELVPFDEQHIHLGKGQMTTTLELEPGVHTLRLQVANGAHLALPGEQLRDTITVTVAGDEAVSPRVWFVQPQ
ncbi:MAG: DUF4399 domain-containing protein, partial [Caldilineaceae bacterium]